MSARNPSNTKNVGQIHLRVLHAEDAPKDLPYVVPQTALTDPRKRVTVTSKFAAYANGQFIPVARLGEPIVLVKRVPSFRAEHLPQDDDHAYNQLQRIVALARRVA